MMSLIDALGPMAYPLLFCSFLLLALLIERTFFFFNLSPLSKKQRRIIISLSTAKRWLEVEKFLDSVRSGSINAIKIIIDNRQQPRQIIEDSSELWLIEEKNKLYSRLGWLVLIAVVSPLLGLLGTVLGMIEAFQAMSANTGAITPALLADGLQQAMLTTAAGLCIAIPALVASHALRIWANCYLQSVETLLNHLLLSTQNNVSEKTNDTTILFKGQIA